MDTRFILFGTHLFLHLRNPINDSPEAITFSWELSTTPSEVTIEGKTKYTASMVIDTTKLSNGKENARLQALEETLYGVGTSADTGKPTLPSPDGVIAIMNGSSPQEESSQ